MSNASTLEAEDRPRLRSQLECVRHLMLKMNCWLTLSDIYWFLHEDYALHCSEAGISARLRELRSMGYVVERRRKGKAQYEYRVLAEKIGAGEQQQLFACARVAGSGM